MSNTRCCKSPRQLDPNSGKAQQARIARDARTNCNQRRLPCSPLQIAQNPRSNPLLPVHSAQSLVDPGALSVLIDKASIDTGICTCFDGDNNVSVVNRALLQCLGESRRIPAKATKVCYTTYVQQIAALSAHTAAAQPADC